MWVNLTPQLTLSFTGAAENELVTAFGVTVPSSSLQILNVTATAQFSDGSSSTAMRAITETMGAGDTFFGFRAPAGQSIVALTLSNSAGNAIPLDDIAFLTSPVPEPSVLLLVGAGLAATASRCRFVPKRS